MGLLRCGVVMAMATVAACGGTVDDDRTAPPPSTTVALVPAAPPSTTATTATTATTTSTTAPVSEPDHAAALVGRTFVDGDAFVRFEHRPDGDVVAWKAACNTAGTTVVISAHRLDIGDQIASTAMACGPEPASADEALAAFMETDPEWTLADGRLTLRSGDEVRTFDEA